MDLRSFIRKEEQLLIAKKFVIDGLMNYQPFLFSEDLEVGAGYEFLGGEFQGLVYWPSVPQEALNSPDLSRFFINNSGKHQFTAANQCLRVMYDHFVDEICSRIGDISQTTFAEIGCNSGYFPLSFSSRGARESVGYDRENYSNVFALLNDILGTNAQFIHQSYNGRTQSIPDCGSYDVVASVAVLCHLADPLQHLAFLGSIARKAIFIWTPITNDDDYCIRFGEPNQYYENDDFPLCFDNKTMPSSKLLKKSLELMGFTNIYEIRNIEGGMPDHWYKKHNAILAMRPSLNE